METGDITLKELRDRVNKAWDHWSKLMSADEMDKCPVNVLYVALEPKLTAAEIEYGRSLVLTENGTVVRRCNKHIDCDEADKQSRVDGAGGVDHCCDPGCKDCFGKHKSTRTCNFHKDCDEADKQSRVDGSGGVYHCTDPGCKDCFGS